MFGSCYRTTYHSILQNKSEQSILIYSETPDDSDDDDAGIHQCSAPLRTIVTNHLVSCKSLARVNWHTATQRKLIENAEWICCIFFSVFPVLRRVQDNPTDLEFMMMFLDEYIDDCRCVVPLAILRAALGIGKEVDDGNKIV